MKKKVLLILVTVIICISGTVFAVTRINADQVTYTDSNNQTTTLDVVLDDLYNQVDDVKNSNYVTSHDATYGVRLASRTSSLSGLSKGKYLVFGDYIVIGYGDANSTSGYSNQSSFYNGTLTPTNAISNCTALSGFRTASFSTTQANSHYAYGEFYKFAWLCDLNNSASLSLTRTELYPNNINTQFLGITALTSTELKDVSLSSASIKYAVSNGTKANSRTATISNLAAGKYIISSNNIYRDYKSSIVSNSGESYKNSVSATKSTTSCTKVDSIWHDTTGTEKTGNSYEAHYYDNMVWVCTLKEKDSLSLTVSNTEDAAHSQQLSLISVKIK